MTDREPTSPNTTLPCAVCRNPLEAMDGDVDTPYGANTFTSPGHYGATAFDSVFGGEHLELHICTPCLATMTANAAIHRVLHPTKRTPEQRNLWRSAEDPSGDTPWNEQRLRNEASMERFGETTPTMTPEWFGLIYAACQDASRSGKVFDPATIPPPAQQDKTRIIAAAQAKVDFYDELRGYPSEWTEIEYAEAEAALKAADAHDSAHGIGRVSTDG
jgi:hypothetical protein